MTVLSVDPNHVFRDFVTDGVPATGANNPRKAEIRRLLTEHQAALMALIVGVGGTVDLPNLLIRYTVTGGSANEIVAEPNLAPPSGPGLALFAIQIEQDNTGPVTLNGKRWLTNAGNEFVAGGIKVGGIYLFLDNGDHWRAITDQDVSALVFEAEGFAHAANEAAIRAEAAAAGVESPVSYAPQTLTQTQQAQARANIGAVSTDDAVPTSDYASLADLASKTVPAAINFVRVAERTAGNGGGAYWSRSVGEPDVPARAKTQDASGAWFKLEPRDGILSPEMLGAQAGLVIEKETRAIFNAMAVKPTKAHLGLIDETVRKLKRYQRSISGVQTSLWDLIGTLHVTAAHTEQAGLLDWKAPSTGLSKIGVGTFVAGKGVAGGGTEPSYQGSVNASAVPKFTQNNAHLACYVTEGANDDGAVVFFAQTNGNDAYIIANRSTTSELRTRLNNGTSSDSASTFTNPLGFKCVSRSAAAGYNQYSSLPSGSPFTAAPDYASGTTLTGRASTGLPNGPLQISPSTSTQRVGVVHAGGALTPFEVDALEEIWREYLLALPAAIATGYPITALALDWAAGISGATNLAAFHDALACASELGLPVQCGAGTYMLAGSLNIPSNTTLRGAGMFKTRLRTDATVIRGNPTIKTGDINDPRWNIVIEDLWADFNLDRTTVDGGTQGAPYGNAVSICYVNHGRINRVYATDAYKHCFDVAGSSYNRSGIDKTVLGYIDQVSTDVEFVDCVGEGAGDDALTSHTSRGVKFIRCEGRVCRGQYSEGNSNGMEIDDFSQDVDVIDCRTSRTHRGLEIKAHGDAAAARNVRVRNYESYKDARGIGIRHMSHGGSGDPVSLSAFDVFVDGATIRHPIAVTSGAGETVLPFGLYAYRRVNGRDIRILQEAAPDDIADTVFYLYTGAGDMRFDGINIVGFPNATYGIRSTATVIGLLHMTGVVIEDGPTNGVTMEIAVGGIGRLDGYSVRAKAGSPGAVSGTGVRNTNTRVTLGIGQVVGYKTATAVI